MAVDVSRSNRTSLDSGSGNMPEIRRRFIPEIQALRTIALFLVVAYHIWFDRVSGGVDVFLLVSSFLMTRSILSATKRGQRFRPFRFLVRRFGRLIPLAATTVVLTLGVSLFVLPVWRWPSLIEDGWASLFYYENRLLQDRATNYYSSDPMTLSPNQQFWSLSIQGQVFVLWAIAHALGITAARLTKSSVRVWFAVGFGAVFVSSLGFSIWMTAASQERAYFDVRARLWEFALGSLLALVGNLRIPRWLARLLTYLGITMIAVCGFVLPVGTSFPGSAALWPLVGAALVLLASTRPTSPSSLLSHPWLVNAGAYSYALYLVHWPILVFAQAISSSGRLSFAGALGVLTASVLVSVVLVHSIEKPFARFQRGDGLKRSGIVVVTFTSLAAAALLAANPYVASKVADDPGSQARQSWSALGHQCETSVLPHYCSTTSEHNSESPRVTFIGSSHIQQYMPSFLPTITREGWQADAYVLPGCTFRTTLGEGREQKCFTVWNEARNGRLLDDTDVLIILGTISTPNGDQTIDGIDAFIREVRAKGVEVITLRDNPRFHKNIFACGEQLGHDHPSCEIPLSAEWDSTFKLHEATARVDLTSKICPDLVCAPMQDGRYVYLDDNHLTATYSETMNVYVDSTLKLVMEQSREE